MKTFFKDDRVLRFKIQHKVLIMSVFFVIFALVFLPLWQVGVNHSLEMRIMDEKIRMMELSEDERMIKTSIASIRNSAASDVILASMSEELAMIASRNV